MSYPSLAPYGYSSTRAEQLPDHTYPARVVRHDGTAVLVVGPHGLMQLRVTPQLDPQPTVGDWLAVHEQDGDGAHDARLDGVLPRTSLLRRQAAAGGGAQALAANVDVVLITCGLDRPVRAGLIDRVAAQAWDAGAHPVLLLTKVGSADAADVDLPRLELEHPGMRVLLSSALEDVGLDELREVVAGRTAVLVGESGAGKSTVTNALLGRAEAATGAVRAKDSKGRHTTTSRQLHLVPGPAGGVIIDTPGIRSLGLAADAESVDAAFAEIHELSASCRFSDCGHRTEPGCAVLEALGAGLLSQGRYDSWLRLQREVESAAVRSSPQALRKYGKRFSRMAKEGAAIKRRAGESSGD